MTKKVYIKTIVLNILAMTAVLPVAIASLNTFAKSKYEEFFVLGSSMQPTLTGDIEKSTYGTSDNSKQAINNINRFDIVICYYPFNTSYSDYSQPYIRGHSTLLSTASLKVKRVIGLPGDTLIIRNEVFTIKNNTIGEITYGGDYEKVPFERNTPISSRVADITLGEDEYFVMGDNWTANGSTDCCNPGGIVNSASPIYKENIAGVVINLVGYCTIVDKMYCLACKNISDTSGTCSRCGSNNLEVVQDVGERSPFEDGPIYLL